MFLEKSFTAKNGRQDGSLRSFDCVVEGIDLELLGSLGHPLGEDDLKAALDILCGDGDSLYVTINGERQPVRLDTTVSHHGGVCDFLLTGFERFELEDDATKLEIYSFVSIAVHRDFNEHRAVDWYVDQRCVHIWATRWAGLTNSRETLFYEQNPELNCPYRGFKALSILTC